MRIKRCGMTEKTNNNGKKYVFFNLTIHNLLIICNIILNCNSQTVFKAIQAIKENSLKHQIDLYQLYVGMRWQK